MTATTPDIAPRMVEGEPVCTGPECSAWLDDHCAQEETSPEYHTPCAPGLRRQRDALQTEVEKLRAAGTELIIVAPHSNVGIGDVERKPIYIELPTVGAMGHGHD